MYKAISVDDMCTNALLPDWQTEYQSSSSENSDMQNQM